MENSFEEVNHARCFNHTLQLSAKTLLVPFNVGMSSTLPASEEDDFETFDKAMLELQDKGAVGNSDGYSDEDSDDDRCNSGGEDLDGKDESDNADSNGPDEFSQLNEQECEQILVDTAIVWQTVTKVHSNLFRLWYHLLVISGPAIIICNCSLNNYCTSSLADNLYSAWVQAMSNPSQCRHLVELNLWYDGICT